MRSEQKSLSPGETQGEGDLIVAYRIIMIMLRISAS